MTDNSVVSQHRSSRLKKNILASFVIKVWSAGIVFLMVPVTLNCLGEYNNGVWLTISSIMLWIDNMDIGLGNGLRNKLAVYIAHNETQRARILVSSTFAMLTYIIIPTMIALLIFITISDNYQLLNIEPSMVGDFDQVLMVMVIFLCTTFIFKLTGNFYMGLQLPAVNNLLIAFGQTLAFIGTYLVYISGSHSLLYIAIVNTASPLLVYLLAFSYTFWYKFPHLRPAISLINLQEAKAVVNVGIQFFIMQISGIILFTTSNILISKFFSPALVTPYQITYRYFSIMLVAFTVICMPYWNATTDAYERGDIKWIRHATKNLRIMTICIAACLVIMVAFSDMVYGLWIGNNIRIDIKISIAVATYIFILIYSMRYSYFINGIGTLRLQLIFTTTAAILFIPLAYYTTRWFHDVISFLAVMCIVNIPGLIVNRIQFYKLINGKASGIWKK